MFTVIGNVQSRTFRVLWMLEELGVTYEHVPAAPRSEAVAAYNPRGKVPVLLVDGQAITDSTAILTYLADRHGALTHPAGSVARARQDAFTFAVLDELDAVLWTAARHSFVLPEDQRVPEIKPSLRGEFATHLAGLGKRIEGPFAMGATMTVPDIVLTHCCNWAVSANFPEPDDRLARYLTQMRARPAFLRARAMGEPQT